MKAKLVVENLNNFIPIYNIKVGQEYYAVDSQFPNENLPEKVKIISIKKDISNMFDVDVMMADGTIDSWYLEPTDNVFTAINEALRDILKPKGKYEIKKAVKSMVNYKNRFVDALDDGDVELVSLIWDSHYIPRGIISRWVEYAFESYADNKTTIENMEIGAITPNFIGLEDVDENYDVMYSDLYNENKKLHRSILFLKNLNLPVKIKEKIKDFEANVN